jgi:uncharacterized protein YkwD
MRRPRRLADRGQPPRHPREHPVPDQRGAHAAPPAAAAREIAQLRAAAVAHSADMVARSYFAHTTPTGQTFVDRILHAGHTRRGDGWSLGENLAWGTGDLGTARGIQAAWMHSSGHRTNILKPAYREVGIGVHRGVPDDAGAGATFTLDFGVKL